MYNIIATGAVTNICLENNEEHQSGQRVNCSRLEPDTSLFILLDLSPELTSSESMKKLSKYHKNQENKKVAFTTHK
jgi:hypothetical protein